MLHCLVLLCSHLCLFMVVLDQFMVGCDFPTRNATLDTDCGSIINTVMIMEPPRFGYDDAQKHIRLVTGHRHSYNNKHAGNTVVWPQILKIYIFTLESNVHLLGESLSHSDRSPPPNNFSNFLSSFVLKTQMNWTSGSVFTKSHVCLYAPLSKNIPKVQLMLRKIGLILLNICLRFHIHVEAFTHDVAPY